MGEIKIKSGNLVESYVTERDQARFSGVLYAELDLKKDTTYTIALNLNNGYRVYINEYIFTGYTEITGDDTVKILSVKTKSDLKKKVTNYTDGKGWLLLKNSINESDYISVADFQILEGTYTSETIPEYQPYFLNRPAHQFVNGQWVDIPTHHFINGRWQGELTSQSPLKFRATGQSLLDWRVDGRTSENLFDIGTSVNDYTRSTTMVSVSSSTITMTIENPGLTLHYRDYNLLSLGQFTICGTSSRAYCRIYIRLRNLDNTGWLTNNDTSIDGFVYNSAYSGWYTNLLTKDFIKTFTIPNVCSYWQIGFGFDSGAGVGTEQTISNIQLLEGSYTADTLPPYEPYGGVGDYDETTQRYKIPVRVEGENLFNSETSTSAYLDVRGVEHPSEKSLTSDYISVNANTGYTLGQTGDIDNKNAHAYCFYNSNKEFISSGTYTPSANGNIIRLLIPNDCAYFRFTYNHLRELVEFVEGSYTTLPPYSTTTNLYADHQLMDGDSIDFATDQTAIPLATGNNILTVDTAVQPSKVFVKFEG